MFLIRMKFFSMSGELFLVSRKCVSCNCELFLEGGSVSCKEEVFLIRIKCIF